MSAAATKIPCAGPTRRPKMRWTDALASCSSCPRPRRSAPVRRARIEMRLAAGAGPIAVGSGCATCCRASPWRSSSRGAWSRQSARVAQRSGDGDGAVVGDVVRPRPHVRAARDPVPPVPIDEPTAAPSVVAHRWCRRRPAEAVRHVSTTPRTNAGGAAARRDPDEPATPGRPRPALRAAPPGRGARAAAGRARCARQRWRWSPNIAAVPDGAPSRSRHGSPRWNRSCVLGRRSEALAVLELLSLDKLPRAAELGVLRGELRAEAGRHRDAIADFTPCADVARCRPETEERALYGRASCRARVGDRAAAPAPTSSVTSCGSRRGGSRAPCERR